MPIGNLQTAGIGFKAVFQEAYDSVKSDYGRITMPVTSTNGREEYGWLGDLPGIREWIGDRQIRELGTYDFQIKNRDFESTVSVDRNDIDDDNLGIYAPRFRQMGQKAAEFPDELVFALLAAGFSTACYDKKNFFATDHPVLDATGQPQNVANTDGGSGTPWFLIDASQALKPIILQTRKPFDFVRLDQPTDENVFMRRKYLYGVDGRMNAGFGLWQTAWGSKQALNATNYAAARAALMSMKGDFGRRLAVRPNLLIVPPSLEAAGRQLLRSDLKSSGETNEWAGTAELLVTPWLA